jgi:hypothetical protein
MGKYCIILTWGGLAMIISGVIAGVTLYAAGEVTDTIASIILCLIIVGILLCGIGFYMLDWRKIFEGNAQKKK